MSKVDLSKARNEKERAIWQHVEDECAACDALKDNPTDVQRVTDEDIVGIYFAKHFAYDLSLNAEEIALIRAKLRYAVVYVRDITSLIRLLKEDILNGTLFRV